MLTKGKNYEEKKKFINVNFTVSYLNKFASVARFEITVRFDFIFAFRFLIQSWNFRGWVINTTLENLKGFRGRFNYASLFVGEPQFVIHIYGH